MSEFDEVIADLVITSERNDQADSTGVVIICACIETNFVQVVGPFPKDTPEALQQLESMRAETAESVFRYAYDVRYLFPPEYSYVGGVRP